MKSISSWACDQTKSVNLSVENSVKKKKTKQNKKHAISIGGQLTPQYDHVILVSGYHVLTAVNWPWMCNIRLHAPTLPRKCDIFKLVSLWCGRTDGRGGWTYSHTVTWLPKLNVWIDGQIFFSCRAPLSSQAENHILKKSTPGFTKSLTLLSVWPILN